MWLVKDVGRALLLLSCDVNGACFRSVDLGADVNKATTNNDHTVLSLGCAGGHLSIVELLLKKGSNASYKLKVRVVIIH